MLLLQPICFFSGNRSQWNKIRLDRFQSNRSTTCDVFLCFLCVQICMFDSTKNFFLISVIATSASASRKRMFKYAKKKYVYILKLFIAVVHRICVYLITFNRENISEHRDNNLNEGEREKMAFTLKTVCWIYRKCSFLTVIMKW